VNFQTLSYAHNEIARQSAAAVQAILSRQQLIAKQITAIGSHGVTIRHMPEAGMTWQIGNPSLLAELTGIDVIADFRNSDIAAGGQGAPLVPAFHQTMFGQINQPTVVLNLGGIANISVLKNGEPLVGFDTGPANTLLDSWCQKHTTNAFDKNGDWAQTGQCIKSLLDALLQADYFSQPWPKSTGKERFNLAWLDEYLDDLGLQEAKPEDIQRTLIDLTARSAAEAISAFLSSGQVVVCGGGARNGLLMSCLREQLNGIKVTTSDEFGLSGDDLEAMAFAWLAYCRINSIKAGLPEVTGAKHATVLGAWHCAS
jgi:anhydro-N-acetylmuramic acid kinase